MKLKIFIRRVILGLPLLAPAYAVNLLAVWVLINGVHFTTGGIISAVVIGDIIAYGFNVWLAPYILLYLKKSRYYSKEELIK